MTSIARSSEDNVMRIYNSIKSRIITGELPLNSKLTETAIARDFGTSRLHVKSAFRMLHSEHLIYHVEKRGYFVQRLDSCFFEEIIALLQALETVVVTRVAEIATQENIATLIKMSNRVKVFIVNEMIEDALEEVDHIYQYLYQICNYTRVISILETYSDYITILRKKSAGTMQHHMDYANNLGMLVQAISTRNLDQAIACIKLRYQYLDDE